MNIRFRPEKFTQHRRVTWIFELAIEVIFHKIEKGGQVGESNPFCLRFSALGDFRHEVLNIIRRNLVKVLVCKILIKLETPAKKYTKATGQKVYRQIV